MSTRHCIGCGEEFGALTAASCYCPRCSIEARSLTAMLWYKAHYGKAPAFYDAMTRRREVVRLLNEKYGYHFEGELPMSAQMMMAVKRQELANANKPIRDDIATCVHCHKLRQKKSLSAQGYCKVCVLAGLDLLDRYRRDTGKPDLCKMQSEHEAARIKGGWRGQRTAGGGGMALRIIERRVSEQQPKGKQ